MFDKLKQLGPKAFVPLAMLVVTACSTVSSPGNVQTQNSTIPVLVLAEDEDPTTVKRSSDITRRVLAQLKESMKRQDFRMVDEELVAAELGWKFRDRHPKTELVRVAKLMNASGKANMRVRAMVLLRIHVSAQSLGFGTAVQTRIDGEIYDTVTNQFLGTYELPGAEYPAPADCIENQVCFNEVVGDRAREIAASLGTVLARKLSYLREQAVGSVSSGGVVTGVGGSSNNFGLETPYTVTLRYFESMETLTIMDVMATEFPGKPSYILLRKEPSVRKYEYVTTAKPHKLDKWLTILLNDMGYNVDTDVQILFTGTDIIIEKINPTTDRPVSEDEQSRFN